MIEKTGTSWIFTTARKDFGPKWQNWMAGGLSSTQLAITINGTLEGYLPTFYCPGNVIHFPLFLYTG